MAIYEAMPQSALLNWKETLKSYLGYSKIDKNWVESIQGNHSQVIHEAKFIREALNIEDIASHLSLEARDYLLAEVEASEKMAQIAMRSAHLGDDRYWVDLLSQYAVQSISAIANFERGIAKGLYSGFYSTSEVMHQVFKNPALINSLSKSIMNAITDPGRLLDKVKDTFFQFNLKLMTGSAEEKGQTIGELTSSLLLLLAANGFGQKALENLVQNIAQKGLLEETGTQLLVEIKATEKLSVALSESEVFAQKVVDSAGIHGIKIVTGPMAKKVDKVIIETLEGKGNLLSNFKLTAGEALQVGETWIGPGYKEIGKPGQGIFRSADGKRQFRMDDDLSSVRMSQMYLIFTFKR